MNAIRIAIVAGCALALTPIAAPAAAVAPEDLFKMTLLEQRADLA